jgi:hypothetical protein
VKSLTVDDRRLKARVVAVQKTGETATIDGEIWEKCIFTLEVTRFSKRTPEEVVPPQLKGKMIRLARHCLYDWHYKLGVEKTLSPEETESLLQEKQTSTIFW